MSCLNSFDAQFQFQPFEATHAPSPGTKSFRNSLLFKLARSLPERYQDLLRGLKAKINNGLTFAKISNGLTFYDYDTVWEKIVEIRPDQGLTTFPGAFVDWDNAARYKQRATIYQGASPEKFCNWFGQLVDSMPRRNLPENFIFLNAWNEWAESTYLEPDERFGYQYLEAVRQVLTEAGAVHVYP